MSNALIRTAIEAELLVAPLNLATSYDNENFLPPNINTPWQRITFVGFETENPTMGSSHYRAVGYFQIDLNYPPGNGATDADTQSELIKTRFKRGSTFTSSGVEVVISHTPSVSVGHIDGNNWVITIKIRYYADIFP